VSGRRKLRSDAERLARTRVLIASVVIYLLCMAFMAAGDQLYAGTRYILYSRLATVPLFLLLVRRWVGLVRVRPPQALAEARRLAALGRQRAARERFAELARAGEDRGTKRLDRARRILQDGLAVPVALELELEMGRCSLALGELERALQELSRAQARLPRRADVALDLARALALSGDEQRAARVLREALPWTDAIDRDTLRGQPRLLQLLAGAPLPAHSAMRPRLLREQALLALLLCGAIVHGLHLYAGVF
jgi:tetratricopeptide (TPR) repeat protein